MYHFIVSFAAAVAVSLFIPQTVNLFVVAGVLFCLAAIVSRAQRLRGYYAMFAGFGLGMLYVLAHMDYWLEKKLPSASKSLETMIEGEVVSMPRKLSGLTRIEISPSSPVARRQESELAAFPGNQGRIRLNCYDCAHDFRLGETWRLTVRLRGIHGLANPGIFDYERWAFQQRLVASGSIARSDDNQRIREPGQHFLSPALRDGLNQFLAESIAPDRGLGVVQAITLGNRDNIDPQHWNVFQRTGTGHLVAISGLHVSLVFAFLYGSLNLASRLWPTLLRYIAAQRIAALLALPPTLYYAWLAGFSLPTQRAVTMLAVFYIAFILGRRVLGWHSFMVALFVVLLVDPFAPLSQGSWLSFGAVAAIIVYAGHCRRASSGHHSESERLWLRAGLKLRALLRGWVGVQVAISFVIVPLAALFFGELAIASPLINLLAIPFFSFSVVPPALLGVFAWILGAEGVAAWLVVLAGDSVTVMQKILLQVAEFRYTALSVGVVDVVRLVLAGLVMFAIRKSRPVKLFAVGALCLLMAIGDPYRLRPGEFVVTVLDVGQGLAVVVRTPNHTMVFDTGISHGQSYDMGAMVVSPFLKATGVGKLDKLVISHGDRDHAGGREAVLLAYPGARVMSSDQASGTSDVPCIEGQGWTWDEVDFEVLWPLDLSANRDNNRSCVIHVSSRFGSALLTGDIEGIAEQRLVRRHRAAVRSDLLLVPHHGSRTSSTRTFLAAVDARVAIVPRGLSNPYGHPHGLVVERLRQRIPTLFDTALDGAVTVYFTDEGIRSEAFRRQSHVVWRSRPLPGAD